MLGYFEEEEDGGGDEDDEGRGGAAEMVGSWSTTKIELVTVRKAAASGRTASASLGSGAASGKEESVKFVEQYAKSVVDFSSQYGSPKSLCYTAYNIVGSPSKFPDYGDFPESFVMRTYGRWWDEAPSKSLDYMPQNNGPIVSHDYIVLEYDLEVYPLRISIYEIYNPGSVIAIWAKDETGQWLKLWNGPPQIVPHKPRIFSPPLQRCNFKTCSLRLEFNHSLLDYYTQLDAVLLIGTSQQLIPNAGFHARNLSSLLRELGEVDYSSSDCYNLTPNYAKVNDDLKTLKSLLHKNCVLHKSKYIDKVPIVKLKAKLSFHRHYIPPIEEAFNSLQKFLQEDFPKLIREINISSSITLSESESEVTEVNVSKDTSYSYFSSLPDEIVVKIFKYLDLRSLCRCSQVNRQFNTIAVDASLYKRLNFKPYWHLINATVLDSFITKCQYLQRLDVSWCGNIQPKDFINFLKATGSSLSHLRLNCCSFVNNDVMQEISITCTNLKELGLRSCNFIHDFGFVCLKNLKNLEVLDLYKTNINSETLCKILRENTHLRHLNLACCDDYPLLMDEVAEELAISCTILESIDMWKSPTLTVRGIRALSNCSNLREIDFGWCSGIGAPGDSLRVLFNSCRNLEKVFLSAFRGLTDRDLEPLLLCRNLKQLDLLGANSLSPEICASLLSCLPLRMLDLSFCDGISDVKIQEWRQNYPHVSIKRSSQV
ncbi:F-box/LRR-repeat protein 4 [Copidosoma floridanum]|uniref:F-box/LRR-repeat protein 4 n=1 Tax=Copidosoma floridanum TaxID=29053 RepID=UPI0006C9B701|nr:F-box/LRR-repeat protein 4 [Copidosoma floridanum]